MPHRKDPIPREEGNGDTHEPTSDPPSLSEVPPRELLEQAARNSYFAINRLDAIDRWTKTVDIRLADHAAAIAVNTGGIGELLAIAKSTEHIARRARIEAERAKAEAARASKPDEAELADRAVLRDLALGNVGATRELAKLEHSDKIVAKAQWRIWVNATGTKFAPLLYTLAGGAVAYALAQLQHC